MQLVHITTNVASFESRSGEVFVSDFRKVGSFLWVLHDITEILLKEALKTITRHDQSLTQCISFVFDKSSWSGKNKLIKPCIEFGS